MPQIKPTNTPEVLMIRMMLQFPSKYQKSQSGLVEHVSNAEM